jgi:hypothetical protein
MMLVCSMEFSDNGVPSFLTSNLSKEVDKDLNQFGWIHCPASLDVALCMIVMKRYLNIYALLLFGCHSKHNNEMLTK